MTGQDQQTLLTAPAFLAVAPLQRAERIAAAIVEQLRDKGHCSIMDILAMGYSMSDIARHWPQACRIAEHENSKWSILND